MHIVAAFVISMCLFAGFHPMKENPKNEVTMDVGGQYPVTADFEVKPLEELQNKSLVKQEYDYSCGSAALATLLNYFLGENLSESQVIYGLMEYGDAQRIAKRRAFSLLDMKRFVNKLGYKGIGYKATIEDMYDIAEMKHPCIVPIEFMGYRHFTVFKGFHGGHIFLADPFRGNTSYPLAAFEDMWYENVVFMVYPEGANTYSALELTNDDLRYIHESVINDLITDYGPEIGYPAQHERDFFFTLPEEYQKYYSR